MKQIKENPTKERTKTDFRCFSFLKALILRNCISQMLYDLLPLKLRKIKISMQKSKFVWGQSYSSFIAQRIEVPRTCVCFLTTQLLTLLAVVLSLHYKTVFQIFIISADFSCKVLSATYDYLPFIIYSYQSVKYVCTYNILN